MGNNATKLTRSDKLKFLELELYKNGFGKETVDKEIKCFDIIHDYAYESHTMFYKELVLAPGSEQFVNAMKDMQKLYHLRYDALYNNKIEQWINHLKTFVYFK